MVNKGLPAVSFVAANELWNWLNKGTDQISLVFSFSDAENTDVRNPPPSMRPAGSETIRGNTTFAVYGYMNRVVHEEVGVAIYYYDMKRIPWKKSAFHFQQSVFRSVSMVLGTSLLQRESICCITW